MYGMNESSMHVSVSVCNYIDATYEMHRIAEVTVELFNSNVLSAYLNMLSILHWNNASKC